MTNHYGPLQTFMQTFTPDAQRTLCPQPERCFFENYPTLAQLRTAYGSEAPTMWLIPQLTNLSEYCGVKEKLQGRALEECAFIIAQTYFYLKVSELLLFFHRFKSGRYGHFYGIIDPLVIALALRQFAYERAQALEWREQEERKRRQAEESRHAICYEEWVKLGHGMPENGTLRVTEREAERATEGAAGEEGVAGEEGGNLERKHATRGIANQSFGNKQVPLLCIIRRTGRM